MIEEKSEQLLCEETAPVVETPPARKSSAAKKRTTPARKKAARKSAAKKKASAKENAEPAPRAKKKPGRERGGAGKRAQAGTENDETVVAAAVVKHETPERIAHGEEKAAAAAAAAAEPAVTGSLADAGTAEEAAKPAPPRQRPRKETALGSPVEGSGLVELSPKGFGFLRQAERNFFQTNKDTFITPDMARTYGLRDGMVVRGEIRKGPRGPQLTAIHTINDRDPKHYRNLPVFEELTAINPCKRLVLETDPDRYTTRVIDLMTPVGRGQRGLIVAPPRTGKTTLLQHIAEAVMENYEQIRCMLLLIDERPEEVTELSRALPGAEIMASSNDSDEKSHARVAHLAIERAKRLVEAGEDVVILLDSITRLARALNNANRGGKRASMSGGIDANALQMARRLFAAARNTREAGSLTILGTALVQTNNRGDEVIFQEFKGTGNMELVLDRQISQQYVYPAVDILKSGTRREELLLPPHQREKIYLIRRGLAGHKPIEAIERLLSFLERFPNNAQMLMEIKVTAEYV